MGSLARDSDGRIFIDRDPAMFALVLQYLRTGEMPRPRTQEERRFLVLELRYFGIPFAQRQVEDMPFKLIVRLFCPWQWKTSSPRTRAKPVAHSAAGEQWWAWQWHRSGPAAA